MKNEPQLGTRSAWLYAAFWLFYLAMYTASLAANGLRLDFAVRNAACTVFPDALLGLAILRLPGTVRWPDVQRSRFYAAHFGVLVLFLAASFLLWSLAIGVDALVFEGRFGIRIAPRLIPWRLLMGVMLYASLAGVAYAWDNAAAGRVHARRAAEAEALRARAELAAMRSQLNPHFVFNTLHTVAGLVRRDPAIAVEAIERLGDLLRYGLRVHREGLDTVAMRDEWQFVQSYLVLERMRLGDRLRLEVAVEDASLECRLPVFALQTLVENAIRHAIAGRREGGRLAIEASSTAGVLNVRVQDDGPGVEWGQAIAGDGLGLRLLRERLAVLYGERGRLTLNGARNGGTCAAIEIPCASATS